jgi:hypothetical protein
VTAEEFCILHPRLYHMATAGALAQIEKYGLLSTEATLDLLKIKGARRADLLLKRRPVSVTLEDPQIGKFVLRDQIPMRDAVLAQCLVGMSIPEWYGLLNERVFMWATQQRVETLLAARAYRKSEHLILTIDTKALVTKYEKQLRFSVINSGATLFKPPSRGPKTFSTLEDFSEVHGAKPIVEVTVKYAIPDMREFIISSETRKAQSI